MPLSSLHPVLRAVVFALMIVLVHGVLAATPAAAQLVVAIEANPGVAVPGEQLEVRITVANQGAGNVAGVLLNLLIPAELDIFQTGITTPGAGGCTQITNNFTCQVGETLIWNLGTIVAGQSVTTSLTPIVSAGALGPIVFNPVLNSGPSASATVTLNAGLTLDVSLHEVADPVAAGDDLAYTLHFGNRSTINTAPNALLRLPLPAGTTFVNASGGGVLNAGAVEWSLGTLAPGQSGTRSVTLDTGAGLVRGASILANAELSDTTPQLARARALTEVDGLESLELAMVVGPDPAAPGEQLEIELTVSNPSALDRATVSLVLRWPQEIDQLSTGQGTSGPGGCIQIANDFFCTAGEFATWNLGTLNAGQSITVSYSADLAAGTPDGAIVDFQATVLSSGADDQARAGRAIAVDATSALEVALHEAADPVAAGDNLVYTISYINTSLTNAAANLLLRLPLPVGTSFVSASGAGVLNGDTVEWSLGTLQPGNSGTRNVTVQTDAGLSRGALLRAEAALSDSALPPLLARAGAVSEIDGLEALETTVDFALDFTDWAWEVDVTVTNTDVVSHTGVGLTLRVPRDALTFPTGSVTGGASGCTQIVNNFTCEAGEFLAWNLGTLTAGQSVTVTLPNLYIAPPTVEPGELFDLHAIALGSGVDDRAVDHAVPEPGVAASLFAGMALIAGLSRSRIRSGIGRTRVEARAGAMAA